jgi:ATP-binding cassette subfamily C protein CydC
MVAMRLAARRMAARLLAEPLAASAEALARMKRDYADRATPCADIAIYGLAPRIATLTADAAAGYDAARLATVRAEARIGAVQALIAVVTVAAMIALSPAGAPLLALGALAALGGLEGWAALAQTDMQAPRVDLARHRLALLAQHGPRPKARTSRAKR